MTTMQRRTLTGWFAVTGMLALAGCASRPRLEETPRDTSIGRWSGRLALTVTGAQPQSFSAGFELQGNPQAGTLELNGPLGTTAALLTWTPVTATLQSGRETRQFSSVDALIAHVTGTPVPAQALFDWLAGKATVAAGWRADLSQLSEGRLIARQTQPPRPAELRIVLQKPRP